MLRKISWRTVLILGFFLYLFCDLKVFKGPIYQQFVKHLPILELTRAQALEKGWVAIVNQEAITQDQLELAVARRIFQRGENWDDLSGNRQLIMKRATLRALIDDVLVRQYADGHRFEAPQKEIDAFIESWKKQFTSEEQLAERTEWQGITEEERDAELARIYSRKKWLESRVAPGVGISEKDLRQWFEDSKIEQLREKREPGDEVPSVLEPEKIRARHIFVRTRGGDPKVKEATIRKARERLVAGEEFAKVARELSDDDRTKDRDGDLNWFSRRRVPEVFRDAVFSQKVGEIGPVFETPIGWYVVEVTDHQPEREVTYDEVKDEIYTYLTNVQRQDSVDLLLGKLRKVANIIVFAENLK